MRSRSSWRAALAGAAFLGSVVVVPAAVPGVAAAANLPLKPLALGAVQIDPEALAGGQVVVAVDPVDDATGTSLAVAGSGEASVSGGAATSVPTTPSSVTATLSLPESGVPADPAVAALADATGSTITATLTGTGAAGAASSSDVVWVDEFAGRILVSEKGEQDLRLQRVAALVEDGTITTASAEALNDQILGGGASSTESVTEGGLCALVCVQGTVLWTDSAGDTYPVDRAPVQIRDQETGQDQVVTTVTTNAAGEYAAIIDNIDGDATGRDVYVRVLASGPGFTIAQRMDSGVTNNVSTGQTVTKNVTANNTADNNTAFSVRAALVIGNDEVVARNGGPLPSVPVVFPSDGSYFDGSAVNLLAPDRFDWDVTLHEFGHYVSEQLDLDNNPGGFHNDSNLSDLHHSKSIGVRLAWGEGWPTYFAVSTLHERASGLGVPNIGDTRYQDTEDADLDDDLEATHTKGEDNELTVMSALWDLYDAASDNRDQVTLGTDAVWQTLDDGDPTTLSAAYQLFSPSRATEGTNCIFSQANVSPKISGQSTTVTNARPLISWRRGNGGSHPNNRFSVKFRSAGGSLLLAGPTVRTNTFKPTRAQWDAILAGAGGTVQISVVGRQADTPATGPYRSCTRSYTID
jgi:hypothetical protein